MRWPAIHCGDCICIDSFPSGRAASGDRAVFQRRKRSANNPPSPALKTVEEKFTASFPSRDLRSSVAPSQLSKNIPARPAPKHAAVSSTRNPRQIPATTATIAPALHPASVPARLMPPSVPAGTIWPDVSKITFPGRDCPISEEAVSAVASTKAAAIAITATARGRPAEANAAVTAAAPKLAHIWETRRPDLGSATPICSFLLRRKRVVNTVSPTNANKGDSAVCHHAPP